MIRTLIFSILLFVSFGSFGQEVLTDSVKEANSLLEKAIAEKGCTGLAAGFSINGNIIWANGQGYSNAENKTAFTEETLTRVASVVKPMTAVAIMQLYEQDMIDLDAPIQRYIPDFPLKKKGDITVRQLLSHTAGVGAYKSAREQQNKKNYTGIAEAVAIFKDRPLVSAPGEAYYYTTYGYVLLGLVIEKVSGITYEAYMKENIWEKAGMQNTGVEYYGREFPGKASLYHKNRKGIKNATPTNLSDRVPGGGVHSCVTDILKFGDAVINNTLIKASTLQLMLNDLGLKKKGNGYGLGWTLYGKNPKYGPVIGHSGAQIGASAQFMILPEQKTTVVTLSNTSGSGKHVSGIAIRLFDIAAAATKE